MHCKVNPALRLILSLKNVALWSYVLFFICQLYGWRTWTSSHLGDEKRTKRPKISLYGCPYSPLQNSFIQLGRNSSYLKTLAATRPDRSEFQSRFAIESMNLHSYRPLRFKQILFPGEHQLFDKLAQPIKTYPIWDYIAAPISFNDPTESVVEDFRLTSFQPKNVP